MQISNSFNDIIKKPHFRQIGNSICLYYNMVNFWVQYHVELRITWTPDILP